MEVNFMERKKYRISGHESFPCRYAWLPKVVRLVQNDPSILSEDEKVMVELGLGKNMVRSARFWAQASGIVNISRNHAFLSTFGDMIFGSGKLDPYLEDISTLWLLHWQLCSSNFEMPLLAWDILFGRWQETEVIPSVVVKYIFNEASKYDDGLSIVTIQQHLDVFLHTYFPTRGKKGKVQEDNLDCPLVELELLRKIGDRSQSMANGERESIYAFRQESKPEIKAELFTYCIADYWMKKYYNEQTIAFRDIAHGHGSPGRVFKLSEDDVRARLENISGTSLDIFNYIESNQIQQLQKDSGRIDTRELLRRIYSSEGSND